MVAAVVTTMMAEDIAVVFGRQMVMEAVVMIMLVLMCIDVCLNLIRTVLFR